MKRILLAAVIGLTLTHGHAATSLDLSRYTLTGSYTLDPLGGLGLEASAVTYARDRNTLFVVGDEGLGVVEVSLTGQALSTMSFSAWPAATQHNDAEGLAYLGNGVLGVAEERLQDAMRFQYVAGGGVSLAAAPRSSISDRPYTRTRFASRAATPGG